MLIYNEVNQKHLCVLSDYSGQRPNTRNKVSLLVKHREIRNLNLNPANCDSPQVFTKDLE